MTSLSEYTSAEVAEHKTKKDLWIIIHGKGEFHIFQTARRTLFILTYCTVYNVTEYVRDHPGGPDVLCDVAGTDATEAYDEIGHSEEADDILETYLVGRLEGTQDVSRPKPALPSQEELLQATTNIPPSTSDSSPTIGGISIASGSIVGVAVLLYLYKGRHLPLDRLWSLLPQLAPAWVHRLPVPGLSLARNGFLNGLLSGFVFSGSAGGLIGVKLSQFTEIESGFTQYPPYIEARKRSEINPHEVKGFLSPKDFKELPLIAKTLLSPGVFLFTFQLPKPQDVVGLPIGQHVAIKVTVNGQSVSRSYTPTSNNFDLGILELVIKCYPDGLLTGKYLANLTVGDKVPFRGPKGAMKYQRGLCRRIGMIAGGTGITPLYQLIRAICEDERDTTEISLIYANQSEEDILLRHELERLHEDTTTSRSGTCWIDPLRIGLTGRDLSRLRS